MDGWEESAIESNPEMRPSEIPTLRMPSCSDGHRHWEVDPRSDEEEMDDDNIGEWIHGYHSYEALSKLPPDSILSIQWT